jgi:hypothetical protein
MVLAGVFFLGVEVDCCQGHVEVIVVWHGDLARSENSTTVRMFELFTLPRLYLGPSNSPVATHPSSRPCLMYLQKSS